jgi:hypothetical protein
LLGWQPIERIGNKFLQCRTSGIQSPPPNAGLRKTARTEAPGRHHVLCPLRAAICLKHLILASGRNCAPGPNSRGAR